MTMFPIFRYNVGLQIFFITYISLAIDQNAVLKNLSMKLKILIVITNFITGKFLSF